jgi:pSer/pThr/pTyr-binding forkhead associated (FHA) protein
MVPVVSDPNARSPGPATPSTAPATAPTTATASTNAPPAPAPPPEEQTQPFRLRELAARQAQRRRRTTAGELTFRRQRHDVRVPLDRSETVIGRDSSCDIVLPEPAVSARHARIVRTSGGYFELQDLGSTNGIVVDGERVERMTLLDGDTFTIGDTRFSILVAPVVGEDP